MKSLKEQIIRPKKNSEEHILPLINVVFLLLIFFMITGQLTTADPFKIAPSKSISAREIDKEQAIIHMAPQGNLAFQNEPVSEELLKEKLAAYLKKHPDVIVRLKVDHTQNAGKVLTLMTSLRRLGIEKLSLITLHEAS
ncbi:MAG: biopolymer transporter ExbD [Methylocystaceae bacterium]|nr:biopolymer transporter ExbD [Methylocystaceae bacterium]